MLRRTDLEKREYQLSELAQKSDKSRGRLVYETPCDYRTEYQRDRDRILHSKAFRRLMHKTQVFLAPEGDHYRTRLTHTLEVCQVSRTVARALGLNEDLTEAIALGHDLGHTPFGHNGEEILNQIHPGGFHHNIQSLRVVDVLESSPSRKGLNLTFEVRDGIVNHSGKEMPSTLEGQIVRICDRVAYINHDIDDAIRSGVLTIDDLPSDALELFGYRHSGRIDCMIKNIVENSDGKDIISMDSLHEEMLLKLRRFMFENVYRSPKVKKDNDLEEVEKIIIVLYNYFLSNPLSLPEESRKRLETDGVEVTVKDYIAGMTDRFAQNLYKEIKK